MRTAAFALFALLWAWPSDASACHRWYGCYGGSGCWGRSCSGCWGGGCYGGRCSGYYGGHAYSTRYGTPVYGSYYSYGAVNGQYAYGATGQYNQFATPSTRSSNYYDANMLNRSVRVEVIVTNPEAKVIVQGVTTSSTGTKRLFESPALENGEYTYTISQSIGNNADMDTRTVSVRAGDHVVVDFNKPTSASTTNRSGELQKLPPPESGIKPKDPLLPR